jgi:putative hydrolases of HD superfamily
MDMSLISRLLASNPRLAQQLEFLGTVDLLKDVQRATRLIHSGRKENSAEHSWHLAVAAIILAEHTDEQVSILRVLQMLLIHDIVEIYAGDTPVFEGNNVREQFEAEGAALEKLSGLLPNDQAPSIRDLWNEFAASTTPEARFAQALDRLVPLLQNILSGGATWKACSQQPTEQQVLERNLPIRKSSHALWEVVEQLVSVATNSGLLVATEESKTK